MSIDISPLGQFANLGDITIAGLIGAMVVFTLIITSISFFFSLIIGGIRWILSGGNREKADVARTQIVNALIGVVVVFSAWAIMSLVNEFFGIDILSMDLPTFY